jgi:hypothetical protein
MTYISELPAFAMDWPARLSRLLEGTSSSPDVTEDPFRLLRTGKLLGGKNMTSLGWELWTKIQLYGYFLIMMRKESHLGSVEQAKIQD